MPTLGSALFEMRAAGAMCFVLDRPFGLPLINDYLVPRPLAGQFYSILWRSRASAGVSAALGYFRKGTHEHPE